MDATDVISTDGITRWGEQQPPEDEMLAEALLDDAGATAYPMNEELNFKVALWQARGFSLGGKPRSQTADLTWWERAKHCVCFLAVFPIAAQSYAFINLLAICLMAVKGPAAVSHRPNTAN